MLQEKEFERVGDNKTIRVDVRVLAATNQHLKDLVQRGQFREDLYYRLKVVEITLPALKQRPDDVQPLVEQFIEEFNYQFKRQVLGLTPRAQALLQSYPWPGNVRELKHAVEHAFILSQDQIIDVGHLPQEVREYRPSKAGPSVGPGLDSESIVAALTVAGGNKAKAARNLNISRQTLYRKIRELGIPTS